MAFAFFRIPLHDDGDRATAELNNFLASHCVVNIERTLIDQGANSVWSFCIEYSTAGPVTAAVRQAPNRASVDYKAILHPDEFEWFSQLRDWRSLLAKEDSIPPYLIFNNQQLAQIVRERMTTKAELLRIDNVGAAKVEKYADAILSQLRAFWGENNAKSE